MSPNTFFLDQFDRKKSRLRNLKLSADPFEKMQILYFSNINDFEV